MTDPPENGSERPDWWRNNEDLRQEMDLPPYHPPRFVGGVHTHEVVSPLEDKYDCTIQFVGLNTRYEDDWQIEIDGERLRSIGRHRDENGNTVYEMTAEAFRKAVAAEFDEE